MCQQSKWLDLPSPFFARNPASLNPKPWPGGTLNKPQPSQKSPIALKKVSSVQCLGLGLRRIGRDPRREFNPSPGFRV